MESARVQLLSAADAADRLGVSVRRVQALAAAGQLPGQRIGNRLVFDARSVRRRSSQAHPSGRPFAPEAAWAVLAAASGWEWPAGNAQLRWRYRARAADVARAAADGRFARRAALQPFRAAPSDIAGIAREKDLVLGGVSAADEYGHDIVAPQAVEAYVDLRSLDDLRRRYWMEPSDVSDANIFLRVVPEGVWDALRGQRYAPAAAAAVDLLEADDDRSRRAGGEALARLAAELP